MWDFLLSEFQHYLKPHKQSTIDWVEKSSGEYELVVNYSKTNHINSSGFRVELFLEPDTTYQIDLEAELNEGEPAFIYVESGHHRLVPRFKIYCGSQGYRLKHNFTTPHASTDSVDESGGYVLVYLGILFHHPDMDYNLRVRRLKLIKIAKLTQETLMKIESDNAEQNAKNYEQSFFDQSFSNLSVNLEKKLSEIENRLGQLQVPTLAVGAAVGPKSRALPVQSVMTEIDDNVSNRKVKEDVMKSVVGNDLDRLVRVSEIGINGDSSLKKTPKLDTSIWLPGTVNEDLIQAMMNRKKALKARIIASVTVIPSRLKTLRQVV